MGEVDCSPAMNRFGKTWKSCRMVVKAKKGCNINLVHIKIKAISFRIWISLSCTLYKAVDPWEKTIIILLAKNQCKRYVVSFLFLYI